jgi:hypothetical protein
MEEKRLYVSAGETWREDAPQEGAGGALPEILVPVPCPLARSQRPVGAGLTRSAHTLQQPVSDYRFAWKAAARPVCPYLRTRLRTTMMRMTLWTEWTMIPIHALWNRREGYARAKMSSREAGMVHG